MESNLSVQIGADVSLLQKGLADAEQQVDNLVTSIGGAATSVGKSFDKMGDDAANLPKRIPQGIVSKLEGEFRDLEQMIERATNPSQIKFLNKELERTEQELRAIRNAGRSGFDDLGKRIGALPTSIGRANNAFGGLKKGGNEANLALVDLSRVVQDAPFGFIGIANNINPLLESFQRLQRSSATTGVFLRSLAGAFFGAGGLGLAIAGVTTAIQIYQNGISGFNRKTKEAKKEADGFKSALESINSQLASEASRVAILVDNLKNETLTKQQRNAAIEELKKINPTYFGQLKEEAGLINNLSAAYTSYLNNLRSKFASRALEKQLEGLFERKLNLEVELDQQTKNRISNTLGTITRDEEKRFKGLLSKSLFELSDEEKNFVARIQRIKQGVKVFDLTGQAQKNQKELGSVNKEIDALLLKLGQLGKTEYKLDPQFGKKETDAALKAAQEALQDEIAKLKLEQISFNAGSLEYKELEARIIELTGAYEALNKSAAQAAFILAEAAKRALEVQNIEPAKVELIQTPSIDTGKALDSLRLGLVQFNDQIKAVIARNAELKASYEETATFLQNTLGPAFDNVFQAIFEGQNIFKAIGNSIKAMVAQLIAAIAKAALFAAILSALPGGAGAGGFSGIFKNLLGFGKLGSLNPGFAGQLAPQVLNGRVEFEIQGEKLIGVLNRTNQLRGING